MTTIATILILAIVVEALVAIWQRLGDWTNKVPTQAVSIVIGVAISVAYSADLLYAIGVCTKVPVIGAVITGVLISRGSNYIHDLLSRISTFRRGTGTDPPDADTDDQIQ